MEYPTFSINCLAQKIATSTYFRKTACFNFDGTLAVTVCANNMLAQAYVLAQSFLKNHPHSQFIICLADERNCTCTYPDILDERIEIIQANQLPIFEFYKFCFQYSFIEFFCALKAYVLQYALNKPESLKIVYLNVEGIVTAPMTNIFKLLDDYSILLSPHRHHPLNCYDANIERILSLRGTFSGGFLAIKATDIAHAFILWWCERVYRHCLDIPQIGYYLDQRWLDYVPQIFDSVHIFRQSGVNAAIWNADENAVTLKHDTFWVKESMPLVFYNFSHVNYTNDLPLFHLWLSVCAPTKGLISLVKTYQILIKQAQKQVGTVGQNEEVYNKFSNGINIPIEVQKIFRINTLWKSWENPFDVSSPDSFWNWLNTPIANDTCMTNLFGYLANDPNNTVASLPIQDRATYALKNFMQCIKNKSLYNLDNIFYQKVLEKRSICKLLKNVHLNEIFF